MEQLPLSQQLSLSKPICAIRQRGASRLRVAPLVNIRQQVTVTGTAGVQNQGFWGVQFPAYVVRRSESATEHPTSIVLGDFADDGQLELLVTKRLIQLDRNTFSCDALAFCYIGSCRRILFLSRYERPRNLILPHRGSIDPLRVCQASGCRLSDFRIQELHFRRQPPARVDDP